MKSKFKSILLLVFAGLTLQTCIRDEVLSPPTVTPLTNNSVVSGSVVMINGTNFDPTTTQVFIDEEEVTIAGSVTQNAVNIIIPATDTKKNVQLFVRTKYGTSPAIELTINPPLPKILKVIPDKAGVGVKIKLQGNNFAAVQSVLFKQGSGSAVNTSFTKIAEDTIQVTVPANVGFDACDISVVASEGSSAPISFTILHPPFIESFTPGSGVNGSIVQVTGQFLSPLVSVKIGSKKLEVITESATAVVARLVAGVVSDTIRISTLGGEGKAAGKFNIAPAPVITSFNKTSGIAGTEITIIGTNLSDAFDVRFGDITTDIISNTATAINVKVPAGATTGKVSVTSTSGTGISPADFIVPAGPVITEFTPTTGTSPVKVTVTGVNFGASTNTPHSISIGSMPLTNVVWADTKIEGNIPAGAVTGKIIITTPNGTFETGNNFLIVGSAQINGFTPANGVAGTIVTITGINMGTAPDVRFNNIKATSIAKATATEIICTVPAGATTGKVSVNGALSANNFTVAAAPVIKSILPARGPINADVTINGEFLNGATVRFANNVVATKVGSDTDTQLKVKVPAGAVTGKITITNLIGAATSSGNFEVLSAPTITSFTPASGVIGSQLVINGTNLQYNAVVRFGAITALVRAASSTQLIVDVPVGATDGKISVQTDGTAAPVLSAVNFDVIGGPVITSLSPTSGTEGTIVSINGTDFSNLESIRFNDIVISSFLSKTATKIEFSVPDIPGVYTMSVNVNVKTSAGTSGNSTFTFNGPPTSISVSPYNMPLGWPILFTGYNIQTVKKVVIHGVTANIDYRNDNAISTKIPTSASTGSGLIKIYYTDEKFFSFDYEIASAPPPGVFPPPMIAIPPSPPSNYVPVAVNADWPDAYNSYHWFRIDADPASVNPDGFSYKPTGTFRIVEHYFEGADPELMSFDGRSGTGTWNRGVVTFRITGLGSFRGVYNQNFQMVFTDNNTGVQLILGNACPSFPNCK